MYILFEGIDTCGKSTQIELLAQRFPKIVVTKEPYNPSLREILLNGNISSKRGELLLFLADRAEHYHQVIKPNLDKTVVSDRGFLSGIGYALANGEFEFNHLLELNRLALYNRFPEQIIFFKIDADTLSKRIGEKSLDKIEERGLEYLLLVQDKMEWSLKKLKISNLIVDASLEIDKIHQTILKYLNL